jgi:hypothetical protein
MLIFSFGEWVDGANISKKRKRKEWIFMSSQNSYVEIVAPKVLVLGDELIKTQSGILFLLVKRPQESSFTLYTTWEVIKKTLRVNMI